MNPERVLVLIILVLVILVLLAYVTPLNLGG